MSGSNAESDMLVELQNRKLMEYLTSNLYMVIITSKREIPIEIDYYWRRPIHYAVFLDGDKVHQSVFRYRRDNFVRDHLKKILGMEVDRFRYTAPLTVSRRIEIVDKIEQKLIEIRKERGITN